MLEKINLDEIGIKSKLKTEVERFKKFQRFVLGSKEKIDIEEVDIRNYAKYILRDGADIEKRELLGCFKNAIVLSDKKISLKE